MTSSASKQQPSSPFCLHRLGRTNVLISEQRDRTQVATRAGSDVVQRVVQRGGPRARGTWELGDLDSEVGAGRLDE